MSRLCVLGLSAGLLVTAVAETAPRGDKPAREVREALRAASRFLDAYPERRAGFLPPGIAHATLDDEIVITHPNLDGTEATTRINTFEHGLINLGNSILAWQDRDNLVRLYSRIHGMLPPQLSPGLPLPSKVAGRALPLVQKAYGALLVRVGLNFDTIVDLLQPATFTTAMTNPIGRCDAESGVEDAGPHSESSGRCEISEYGVDGLMRSFDFPLEDNLTCVRDQGRRGSCTAFAAMATVESLAMVQGAPPQTLSEQYFYYRGETSGDALASLYQMQVQGLSLHLALEAHVDNGFGVHLEQDWNYNRALAMGDAEIDPSLLVISYPDSCGIGANDYSGESCTDFVYQTQTSVIFIGIPEPGPPPPLPAPAHTIVSNSYLPAGPPDVTEGALQTAVMLLAGDVPLMVGLFITRGLEDTVDGYVRDVPGDPVVGGHDMALIGFVPNDELPSNITPATEQGYFIVKNSWGIPHGDCGFLYLDYGYVEKHLDYLSVIDIN